ncbi:MAG: class I SAM-dependent methyltransferase [Candidatus Velthaea sp.]
MPSGRRAGQRFDAAHRVTTEALIFLGELDPENVGPGIEFATHYEATPVEHAQQLLDAVPLAPERATFVDVGSGMGRVVLLAAERPYRQVIGVEISPALHEIAKGNRAAYPAARLRCGDIRLVRADAASFAFPRGDLVVYLYNPFRREVLEPVLDALLLERADREIVLLYHTPLERGAIEARNRFDVIADTGFGSMYRLRREV